MAQRLSPDSHACPSPRCRRVVLVPHGALLELELERLLDTPDSPTASGSAGISANLAASSPSVQVSTRCLVQPSSATLVV